MAVKKLTIRACFFCLQDSTAYSFSTYKNDLNAMFGLSNLAVPSSFDSGCYILP